MNLIYIILIVILVVLAIPVLFGLLLPVFKPRLSQNGSIYLYAFSSGFFFILGVFGFLSEAKEDLIGWFELNNTPIVNQWLISISILGLVSAFVLTSSLFIKYLLVKKIGNKDAKDHGVHEGHDQHQVHNHDQLIYNPNDVDPKAKLFSILLILAHKIPGGLILGFLIFSISEKQDIDLLQIMFLVTFILHMIPEALIIFYRQIEVGIDKWKATLNSFLATMILIPFIFIGAYSSSAIHSNANFEIIFAIAKVCVGSFFIYTALIEFIPEFLHQNINAKTWYFSMIFLIIGIVSCLSIFSVHAH